MIIVYLSPVPWRSIAQRPHFFAEYSLKNGVEKFIWVEPVASRFPQLSDFKSKIIGVESGSFDVPNGIEVIHAGLLMPIEPLHKLYHIINYFKLKKVRDVICSKIKNSSNVKLVCGKPSLLGLKLINEISFSSVEFDVMDDYPHFFSGMAAQSMEKILSISLSKSDRVWFSSSALIEKYKSSVKNSILIKNACDKGFYYRLKNTKKPENSSKQIVYGYVGSIAKWFDWDFVRKLAESKPEALIKLIGPVYTHIPSLPDNVIMHSAIEHKYVASMLKEFDYGLIPFKICKLTEAVDPVKYYEYVAAGLPVITTEFGEMKNRVSNNYAVTLEGHLTCISPIQENLKFWDDRFHGII